MDNVIVFKGAKLRKTIERAIELDARGVDITEAMADFFTFIRLHPESRIFETFVKFDISIELAKEYLPNKSGQRYAKYKRKQQKGIIT